MPTAAQFPIEGGCDCKTIRYRMDTKPLFVHCCHCKWCQRESGASFALNAMIESDRVVNLGTEPEVIHTPSDSGLGQLIARCPACKVAVWSHYAGSGPVTRFVRVGTLDQPDLLPPVPAGVQPVIRLANPPTGTVRWNDLVKGPIAIDNDEIDDLILVRPPPEGSPEGTPGVPTYNYAVVVDDWQDPAKDLRDNWHKELRDAGRFDTGLAARLLLMPTALPTALCQAPVSWVIGPAGAAQQYPFLQVASTSAGVRDVRLWRVDRRVAAVFSSLRCEGTPSADSASR